MSKRIIALLLCAVMLIPCFAGCASKEDGDLGAYITMYLTDDIFDFDPANAYYNTDTLNVVSMLFDTLFKLDDDGKVKKSLAEEYVFAVDEETGELYMEITLKEAYWSNGIRLSADDVVFAWKRLLKSSNELKASTETDTEEETGTTNKKQLATSNTANTYNAAALLYDIKNARAVKEGDASVDDLGLTAEAIDVVRIVFEGDVDRDQFLLNLTSIATAPLYESYVTKNADWAKKPSTMVTSGPFKIGKIVYQSRLEDTNGNGVRDDEDKEIKAKDNFAIDKHGLFGNSVSYATKEINYFFLERNIYYDRDTERDAIDESVKPYRILVDCSKSDADILDDYKNGKLFYIGNIPLSLRGDEFVKANAKVTDALSTFVLYMNENAEIGGETLFANAKVRKALSLAIDREAIANEIVFAKAATGLVPTGVFEGNSYSTKTDFRTTGGELISATAKMDEAKALLNEAGITASKYEFTIKVAGYDDVHIAIVDKIVEAWTELGFTVNKEEVHPIVNNDYYKEVDAEPSDVCDDLLIESIQRQKFEVIAFDSNAYSADAYSVLANYALAFSGMPLDLSGKDGIAVQKPHATGYNSEAYNDLMEAIYYIPYFATLPTDDAELAKLATSDLFPGIFDSVEEYKAAYDAVKAVYDEHGITPTTDVAAWAGQKAKLLHIAEEMLVEDMPVIPVVFNQNAVLVSDDLSNVKSSFYIPAIFQTTKLKNYTDYAYVEVKGDKEETISIFAEFPTIAWDKIGK